MSTPLPLFRSPEFLRTHALHTMNFYHPRAVDSSGGFFHFLMDNGTVYDAHTRHLVSSTRLVYTHAMAWRTWHQQGHREGLVHAFAFLRQAHRNPETGGYAWVLNWRNGHATMQDDTNHAYGLAFVLLAHAHAHMAGLQEAHAGMAETFELLEQHFWEPTHGLYADEADAQWNLSPYRGQNANMHLCEALLAAFDATGETRYLDRAEQLADHICIRQAALAQEMVWEHYQANWQVDWDYNRHDSSNIFRPWGYQPGHLTEWSKLLLLLNQRRPRADLLPRAQAFFDAAVSRAWDPTHGGLFYGFAPDGSICDDHKYFWVQAESIAAAARLAVAHESAGQVDAATACWDWYDRLWTYAWEHFVDHEHGAWWRILSADNRKLSAEKSPAGKVDYHTMGACHDVLDALGHGAPRKN